MDNQFTSCLGNDYVFIKLVNFYIIKNPNIIGGIIMGREFITTTKGIDRNSFPYKQYQRAKKFYWDPQKIDFSQDKEDWRKLSDEEKHDLTMVIASFQSGEEAVTADILPLMLAISNEGRLEEEMFLTTFLFEEAKHMEFFDRFISEVEISPNIAHYPGENINKLFEEILPNAMNKLLHDQSPEAIAEAATVYNMFVEGVMAETGYYGLVEGLKGRGILLGFLEGINNVKMDESRHISYGTYLIQRIINEYPHVYNLVVKKLDELDELRFNFPAAEGGSSDVEGENAFGVKYSDMVAFSNKQMKVRKEILKRAYGQSKNSARP